MWSVVSEYVGEIPTHFQTQLVLFCPIPACRLNIHCKLQMLTMHNFSALYCLMRSLGDYS